MKTYLRDLKPGDHFYPASKIGKKTPIFKIVGPCEWSRGGTSVRRCIDLSKNEFVNKQCKIQVIKTQK